MSSPRIVVSFGEHSALLENWQDQETGKQTTAAVLFDANGAVLAYAPDSGFEFSERGARRLLRHPAAFVRAHSIAYPEVAIAAKAAGWNVANNKQAFRSVGCKILPFCSFHSVRG